MNAVRFNASRSVPLATIDGVTGYGTVRLAPAGEKWEIDRIYVRVSSTVNESKCRVYNGLVRPDAILDGTDAGSTGDTTDTRIYLEDGQALIVEWSGGDNGAIATVTLSGWKSQPMGGFRAVH